MSGGTGEVRWNAATQKWETVEEGSGAPAPPVPTAPPAPPPLPAMPPRTPDPDPYPKTTGAHPTTGAHAEPQPFPESPAYPESPLYPEPPPYPEPRRARRVPVAVVIALVVVAAAGAGSGWFLARGGSDHPKAAASPSAPPSPLPSGTAERTGGGGPTPSPSASASPSATVPAGFQLVQDPRGFRMYVPTGWTRRDQGAKGVFYNAPDGARLIQVYPVSEAGLSPYDALKQTSGELAKNPGYQEISLTGDATVPGITGPVARLVYAYDNQQLGHRRQVADYAFPTPGGEQYAVLSAAPADAWPEQEDTLRTALTVFCAGSDCPSRPAR
ncbi:hypothetical protein OG432_12330 [Streptomyces sp. NBC_00442]|uniref:hypothetical protein n=1 Tax=Streptomyces sp. NBC_00442 TaxID=2903651 RepID=UPI002E1A0D3E